MMTSLSTAARCACAVLTALAVLPAAAGPRMSERQKRLVWWVLACTGILVAFLPLSRRLTHSNLAHYYIGAKYHIPYFDFYRVIKAAKEQPQIGHRDLRHPHRMVRADAREQRFYYLDLLNRSGSSIPDYAANEELARLCENTGLFRREADEILAQWSRGDFRRVNELCADLALLQLDTDDNGFNGSPFYVLLRQADPSLYGRFGWRVALLNMLWQFAAVFFALHLIGEALHLSPTERSFTLALFFCSWDFSGWALNGLSFGGWFLPLTLAFYGWSKQRPALVGVGLAWAGLLKLFPFVLILPIVSLWVRAAYMRWRSDRSIETTCAASLALRSLAWTAVATLALFALSLFARVSWTDFLKKIFVQFHESIFSANTVGLAQVLLALGIPKAQLPTLITGFLWLWAVALFIHGPVIDNASKQLAHTGLLLISLLGWLMGNWFNYYAIVSLLLLPHLLSRRPRFVRGMTVAFAVAYALPDFDRCYLDHRPWLALIKALPFLILPVWALADRMSTLAQEGRAPEPLIRVGRVIFSLGLVAIMAVICRTVYRIHSARAAVQLADVFQRMGRSNEALTQLQRAWEWVSNDALLALRLAQQYSDQGKHELASRCYATAARLAPDLGPAWTGLGILMAREEQTLQALRFFARAVRTSPHDEIARYNYAVALESAGMAAAAHEQAQWAIWLRPDFSEARRLRDKLALPAAF